MPRPKSQKDETLQSMIGVQIPTVRRKRIKVQVIGTKVLVLKEMWRDVFGDKDMNDTEKLPRAVEAIAACCVDVEGHPCINATAFKGAMIDGIGLAKKITKKGAAGLFHVLGNTHRENRQPKSDVRVYGIPIPRHDIGNLPGGRGKCPMNRSQFIDWAVELELEFMPDFISETQLCNLVNLGGMICGVGDLRTGAKEARNISGGEFRLAEEGEFEKYVKEYGAVRVVGPREKRAVVGVKPSKNARQTVAAS